MSAVHNYPRHKRHPGRDSRKTKPRTNVVAFRVFTQEEYDLLKPYLDPTVPYYIRNK